MANVPNSSLKTWNDGDTFHATDYSQDRSILQAGINDNYSKINLNNTALNLALSLQQLKTNDLSDDGSNYTGKWYNMLPSQISSSTFNLFEKKWTATEGQTVFQLTGSDTLYTPNSKTTWVMVGGVPQTVGEGYTETDNKTITLAEGVSAGIEVEMRYFLNNASTETPITNMVGFQENVAVPLADISIDVKSPTYGAKGDGVTDDTQAIQNAINSGYSVYVPSGTYLVKGLIIPSNLVLKGAGVQKTIFKLPNGANTDIFISQNFSSLTGGNTNSGVSGVTLRDFTIDGNKSNNTTGWGIRKYAYRWEIENVTIKNCPSGGVYSEWCNVQTAGADGDFMEDFLENLRVHHNGGIAIQWRGPHDSRFTHLLVYSNLSHGVSVESGSNYSAGGTMFTHAHLYGNSGNGLQTLGGANVYCSLLESETNTLDGVLLNGNNNQIVGGSFYNNLQNGVELASSSAGNFIQFQAQGNSVSQLALTSDGGNNLITACTYNTASSQSSMSGSVNGTTLLQIQGNGSGTTNAQTHMPGYISGTASARAWLQGSGDGTTTTFTLTLNSNSPFSSAPFVVHDTNQTIASKVTNIINTKGGALTCNVTFASAPATGTNNITYTFFIMS